MVGGDRRRTGEMVGSVGRTVGSDGDRVGESDGIRRIEVDTRVSRSVERVEAEVER